MHLLNWDFDAKKWEICVVPDVGLDMGDGVARIIHLPHGGGALLAGPGVLVNGISPLPLAILVNRDEILAAGRAWRYSSDTTADTFLFHSSGRSVHCARCHGALAEGDRVVRCPSQSCRAYHHESCWRWEQAPGCQKCGHPAADRPGRPEPLV